jgi:NAD+ kinase
LQIKRIGIIYNPLSEEAIHFSMQFAATLEQRGFGVWRGTSQDMYNHTEWLEMLDLLIAFGGDGTMLRAARMAFPHNIPVFTVALGRLNFMAEMTPDTLDEGLQTLLDGGGWLDRRTLIHTTLQRRGQTMGVFTALNEVVVSRGDIGRIVAVDVLIDDIPLTTYRADGVLVATATGSTAYALSAGGPILDPRSRALVLVPVAAHLTAVPSMVLHEDSLVTLVVQSCRHATLAVDGRENVLVYEGDKIQICRSNKVCSFVRVHPQSQFFAGLVRRLRRE